MGCRRATPPPLSRTVSCAGSRFRGRACVARARAPKLALAEAPDRPPEPDGDRVVVNRGDVGEFVLEVSRPDPVREHDRVTHAQLGDCLRGPDRVKQLPTRVHGVGNRDQMLIKLSRSMGPTRVRTDPPRPRRRAPPAHHPPRPKRHPCLTDRPAAPAPDPQTPSEPAQRVDRRFAAGRATLDAAGRWLLVAECGYEIRADRVTASGAKQSPPERLRPAWLDRRAGTVRG